MKGNRVDVAYSYAIHCIKKKIGCWIESMMSKCIFFILFFRPAKNECWCGGCCVHFSYCFVNFFGCLIKSMSYSTFSTFFFYKPAGNDCYHDGCLTCNPRQMLKEARPWLSPKTCRCQPKKRSCARCSVNTAPWRGFWCRPTAARPSWSSRNRRKPSALSPNWPTEG